MFLKISTIVNVIQSDMGSNRESAASPEFSYETRNKWLEFYLSSHDVYVVAKQLSNFLNWKPLMHLISLRHQSNVLNLDSYKRELNILGPCRDIVLLFPLT